MPFRFEAHCYSTKPEALAALHAKGVFGGLYIESAAMGLESSVSLSGWTISYDDAGLPYLNQVGGTGGIIPAVIVSFPSCTTVGPIHPEWDINVELLEIGFMGIITLWAAGLAVGLIISQVRKVRNAT